MTEMFRAFAEIIGNFALITIQNLLNCFCMKFKSATQAALKNKLNSNIIQSKDILI